jgi:DNA repair exonuclease SbcCD ATPase subunit
MKTTRCKLTFPLAGALSVIVLGCEGASPGEDEAMSPVAEETRDLEEALEDPAPDQLESLEQSVEKTTQKLARLEEQMARTKTGISDEVLEERDELKAAMREQQTRVREKIQEAARAAQRYNELNDRATRLLERTAPPEIEAEVAVTIAKFPAKIDLEASAEDRVIELERNEISGTGEDGPSVEAQRGSPNEGDGEDER